MGAQLHRLGIYSASTAVVMFIAVVITGYLSTAPAAEDDVAKKLIGTWRGVHVRGYGGDNNRTLIIESAKRDGEQWVAEGRYGPAENPRAKVQIVVTVSGNAVVLDFNTLDGKVPLHLKLEDGNELNGHARVDYPARRSFFNENVKLKRVE